MSCPALTPAENKAILIRRGVLVENIGDLDAAVKQLSTVLALLTSPDKAEREKAKRITREWQKAGS